MIDEAAVSKEGSSQVELWLSSFCCEKDRDIENYLHHRAVQFELLSKSRTYLLCDNDVTSEKSLHIFGFFTVALKALDLPEWLSNRQRLDLDGFSAKLHGEPIKSVPCYLLGQLAKNSAAPNNVSGAVLINHAVSVIKSAAETVGGRHILVECRNEPHLRKFYTDNRFREFDAISDGDIPMVQMLRPIY